MNTIKAKVNARLLAKADRLFTGTLAGRIAELLQNARRAGATRVDIRNEDNRVTVQDNGRGIEDFSKLLDMGASGWDERTETSEDPAGVGLFCLAPRTVTIRSAGKMVTIDNRGWTGKPVPVQDSEGIQSGTAIEFEEGPWTFEEVEPHAVFSGMEVVVDGVPCVREPFLPAETTQCPSLGCRLAVVDRWNLGKRHSTWRERIGHGNVLVNFHGQIVGFSYRPVAVWDICFLVEMTGEPTGIRLMLPARTCLVENPAFEKLKKALEIEAFRYVQKQGKHRLPYKEYLKAKELGIDLPEAEPTFTPGLLEDVNSLEPVAVNMPKDFPLAKCWVLDPERKDGEETDPANAHLLAALGKFDSPFVPVTVWEAYQDYKWAQLPKIKDVRVCVGNELHEDWLWSGKLICVDSLTIQVDTTDGRTWESPVCMAIRPASTEMRRSWVDTEVLVTLSARERPDPSDIWFHLGGYDINGDSYDTQASAFSRDLDAFWADMVGPDEHLRLAMIAAASDIPGKWQSARIDADGRMTIEFADGTQKVVEAPGNVTVSA